MIFTRCLRRDLVKKKYKIIDRRTLVNNISNDYIVNSGRPDLEIPDICFPDYLTPYQTKFENFVALECAETKRKYTFADVRDKSDNLSKSLRTILKLETGDVVAIVLRNIPEYSIATLGTMKANLVVTTVSPVFTSVEMSRQLQDSGAKALITEVELHANVKAAMRIIEKDLTTLVIKTKKDQSIPEKTIDFHEFVNLKSDCPKIPPGRSDDVVLLSYSSGTTGLPKGVELTHKNLVANTMQGNSCDKSYVCEATGSFQEVIPNILPFYHIFGQAILNGINIVGGKMIVMPNFSPELYISVLQNNKCTILYLVPPLVLMLTYNEAVRKENLEHVKAIISGGAPLAISDEQQFTKKFGNEIMFLQGYGLTESSPIVTGLYPTIMENVNLYRGSIGRPVPNTLTKIVNPEDPTNTPLGPNVTGELLIKGPQVMKGYLNAPAETKKAITEDGWLRSGDLGHYNNDGFIFITDRLKELIKVKGNQVAPAELEGVIRSFSGVAEAGVIGVPHETSGEVPRAYIVAKKGLDLQKLNEFVNERVARYKQLKGGVVVVDTIPKNAAGKILRRELKELYLRKKL